MGGRGIGGLVKEWLKAWLWPPMVIAPLTELEKPPGPPRKELLIAWLPIGLLEALAIDML